MKSHEAAALFPLMDGVDLTRLVDDVREHGLLEPIVLLDGEILDGRNRLRACELAKVEPAFVEAKLNGLSPVEYVVSHNLHRRHLTTGQRAALALDVLPRLEAEAKERQRLSEGRGVKGSPVSDDLLGRADEKAAALVGLGRSTIATAKAIQQRDPEVIDRMRAGEIETVEAARRAAGYDRPDVIDDGVTDERGRAMGPHYGKGDKWVEAAGPLLRYLTAWEKRGFEYRHVNWREARKRLDAIDRLEAGLQAARVDLERRAVKPTLTLGGTP